MWDDMAVFRALWQRIARLFGGGKREERHQAPGGIPAPETLVAKVANVKNKDRDILRVAGEALRRGHPDQAVIAYWKAVQVYLKDGQVLKAISALKMILQHSPEDLEAFTALSDAYEALDRKRDAANTCLWIADIHARRGEKAEALASLYRSVDLDPSVKGARERIQALGGELPASALRPPSQMGPPLRLQSAEAAPARPPSQQLKPAPAPQPALTPTPTPAPAPPRAASMGLPPIMGIPLSAPKPRDDELELDLEEDEIEFPDDSLVLPVTDKQEDSQAGTILATEEEVSAEGDSTIAMAAMDSDAGTIAMKALGDDGEVMSVDLAGDQTILAMDAPPWEGPTDEHNARSVDSFDEITEAPDEPPPPEVLTEGLALPTPPRKFSIPVASTTVDASPPSSMVGSEHDPQPKVGIPGDSTRAYSVEELRKLGVKPPKE